MALSHADLGFLGPYRGGPQNAAYAAHHDPYRVVWVYACVNARSAAASGSPIEFYRLDENGDEALIGDPGDPINLLFCPPKKNQVPSLRELVRRTMIHLLLQGGLYYVFERARGSSVFTDVSIRTVAQVRPNRDRDTDEILDYVEYDKMGRPVRGFLKNEILPVLFYNPHRAGEPLSPISAARMSLNSEISINAWNAGFFNKGLRTPFLMETRRNLGQEQEKDLQRRIRHFYGGIDNAHDVMVVPAGAKMIPVGMPAKDLDFINGKKLSREEILAVFGVPPAIVGILEHANYSNAREQTQTFWTNTVLPDQTGLCELIQLNILDPFFPGTFLRFNNSKVRAIRPDPVELAPAVKTYFEVGYDRDEIAAILDEPTLVGNRADDALVAVEEEGDEEESPGAVLVGPEEPLASGFRLKLDEGDLRRYGRAHGSLIGEEEERYIRVFGRFFQELARSLNRRIEQGQAAEVDRERWAGVFEGFLMPVVEDTAELSAQVGVLELSHAAGRGTIRTPDRAPAKSVDISRYMTDDQIAAFRLAVTEFTSRIVGVGDNVINDLNQRLLVAVPAGATVQQTKRIAREVIGETWRGRGLTIARTTANGAYNAARNALFEGQGVRRIQWVSAGDNHVRELHALENGNMVEFGEVFPVTRLRYPHDPAGSPEAVINCVTEDSLLGGADISKFYRRFYSGDIVTIKTESGKVLSVTPNHPILTRQGWVPANELVQGQDVFSARLCDMTGVRFLNVQYPVASAGQIFDALSKRWSTQRVGSVELDFHGDGRDGDIDIIRADSQLWNWIQSELIEPFCHFHFTRPEIFQRYLIVARTLFSYFDRIFISAPRIVGMRDNIFSFFFAQLGHPDHIGFANSSSFQSQLFESRFDSGSGDSVFFGQGKNRHTRFKIFSELVERNVPFSCRTDRNAFPAQASAYNTSRYSELTRDLLGAIPFSVQPDQILDIGIRIYKGHVYNVENAGRHPVYTSNGVVSSNCRCTTSAAQVADPLQPAERRRPIDDAGAVASLARVSVNRAVGVAFKDLHKRLPSGRTARVRKVAERLIERPGAWQAVADGLDALPAPAASAVLAGFTFGADSQVGIALSSDGHAAVAAALNQFLPTRLRELPALQLVGDPTLATLRYADDVLVLPSDRLALAGLYLADPLAYVVSGLDVERAITAVQGLGHGLGYHLMRHDPQTADFARIYFKRRAGDAPLVPLRSGHLGVSGFPIEEMGRVYAAELDRGSRRSSRFWQGSEIVPHFISRLISLPWTRAAFAQLENQSAVREAVARGLVPLLEDARALHAFLAFLHGEF